MLHFNHSELSSLRLCPVPFTDCSFLHYKTVSIHFNETHLMVGAAEMCYEAFNFLAAAFLSVSL